MGQPTSLPFLVLLGKGIFFFSLVGLYSTTLVPKSICCRLTKGFTLVWRKLVGSLFFNHENSRQSVLLTVRYTHIEIYTGGKVLTTRIPIGHSLCILSTFDLLFPSVTRPTSFCSFFLQLFGIQRDSFKESGAACNTPCVHCLRYYCSSITYQLLV